MDQSGIELDEAVEHICVVCLDYPCSTRFGGCGHSCLCGRCLTRLMLENPRFPRCPMCRSVIDASLTVQGPEIALQPRWVAHALEGPDAYQDDIDDGGVGDGSDAHEEVGSDIELERFHALFNSQGINLLRATAQVDELSERRAELIIERNDRDDRIQGLMVDIQNRDHQIQEAQDAVRTSADTIECLQVRLANMTSDFATFRESSDAELTTVRERELAIQEHFSREMRAVEATLEIRETELATMGYQLDNVHCDDWFYSTHNPLPSS